MRTTLVALLVCSAGVACAAPPATAEAAKTQVSGPTRPPIPVDFTKIDGHATAPAPSEAQSSVRGLAEYLAKPASNDKDKARALFRWIAANVSYDSASFFSGKCPAQDADSVLKRRTAVCAGYAALFQALAGCVGLEAKTVGGIAKGYGYEPGGGLPGTKNHDWNLVKIDSSWRFVDPTWGAGHLDENGKYVRQFDKHFFLTPPDQFVYSHLPEDSQWQLLGQPLTKEQFAQLPILKSYFFTNGLSLTDERTSTIQCDGPQRIEIASPEGVVVDGVLEQNSVEIPLRTFSQRQGDRYQIDFACPRGGKYILNIYTRPRGETLSYLSAQFLVVDSLPSHDATFPEQMGTFHDNKTYVLSPRSGVLAAGNQPFKVAIPGARKVSVISGGKWMQLKGRQGVFEGSCTLASGDAKLAAQFDGTDRYDVLLRYDVR